MAITVAPADPYKDHAAIRSLMRRKRDEWQKGREPFVRAAYRNLLFYRGLQWIRWDRAINRFRPARLTKGTPTPMTNIFSSTLDAVASVFARIEPRLLFAPGSETDPEDRAAADVASRVMEVIEDEVEVRSMRQILAAWVALTGGAWLETGYDPDPEHGTRQLLASVCQAPGCGHVQAPGAPACEDCGVSGPADVMQTVPIGRMYLDVVSLFEMYFDAGVTDWTKQRGYRREKSVSIDEAKRRWPALAETLQPNTAGSTADEWYAEALPTLPPALDETSSTRFLASVRLRADRVTEAWHWQRPDSTYPDGLLAIEVGRDQLAHAGPIPYGSRRADGSRAPFLPHVWFPQKYVPGSGYPKTVADDLAHKQAQRNRWESIIEACGMRMGSPTWLIPGGCGVQGFTGEPGAKMYWTPNPIAPNAKPERLQGLGIPLAFIQMIEKIDKTFEELAATFDVIKGARPAGVSAGIALQILQERGQSRFAPLFITWENAWGAWSRQALDIFREFVTEERLRRIQGRDGGWEVEKFLGADLRGRVDVMPEAGSSTPRSTLVERAEIEQLLTLGVLSPAEPEVRHKILETYGKLYMVPTMAADVKNAMRENEAFEALAQDPTLSQAIGDDIMALEQMPYPLIIQQMRLRGVTIPKVRAAVDNHGLHSREHGSFLKAERSQRLPEIVQVLAERHKAYHDELMIQQMQSVVGLNAQPNPSGGFLAKPATSPMQGASSPMGLEGQGQEMMGEMAQSAS